MCNAQTPLITYQVILDSPEKPMITMYCTCTVVDPVCVLLLDPCVPSAADKNVMYSNCKSGARVDEMRKMCHIILIQHAYRYFP